MSSATTDPAAAFYQNLGGGSYQSGPATGGPWNPKVQHAGPPSALLGRAMERHAPRAGLRVARVTLDIPRPVPVGVLRPSVRTIRSGSRTELLEGTLYADDEPVMLARAWRMVASPDTTPAPRPEPGPPALPPVESTPAMAGAHLDGYVSAMEWRFPPGEGFGSAGPGTVWARQRLPLVAGEPDSPLIRALTLADSSWAVAFELDHTRQFVINTDVTLALHRDPIGEWLCLRSATAASPQGSGLAQGQLDDAAGDCGRVLQTLLVADL